MKLRDFEKDLEKGQEAEKIVAASFAAKNPGWVVEEVGNVKEYYHRGDIKITNKETGEERFIEVKNDSRTANSHCFLCEESVSYADGYIVDGNMYSNYDIYAVYAAQEARIYYIDFSLLVKHYKAGEFKVIPHSQQTTYAYIVDLAQIKSWGALMGITELNF